MAGTIPASIDVNVIPSVIGAGGTALSTIGLVLDISGIVPISPLGATLAFPDANAVADYFGLGSSQATFAATYFDGYSGRSAVPASILYTSYPAWSVSAYLRGGPVIDSVAQLQAMTGSLTVLVDGYAHVISSISLASYSSYSAMAAGITSAFTDPTEASFTASMGANFTATAGSPATQLVVTSVTGFISMGDVAIGTGITTGTTFVSQVSGATGGAGTYVLSATNTASAATCTSTSAILDVTICASPTLAVGQTVVGTSVQVGTLITSQISGTAGGVGIYLTSVAGQHVTGAALTAAATAPVVTFSSLFDAFVVTSGITGVASLAAYATGSLSGPLALTASNGAILSQGAAATTPAAFMTALTQQNQNFVSFTTEFDPDQAFFIGTISTTTLTVSSVVSGAIKIGDTVNGVGVTSGTVVTGFGTGSGGVGTYTISPSQTVSVATNMSSNLPGGSHGNTQKLAFAAWNNSVPDTYAYAMWDSDITPTLSAAATTSAGYIVTTTEEYEGTIPIYEPTDFNHAAFIMGSIASINFNKPGGRVSFKYLGAGGLTASVTTETVATNLGSGETQGPNGYNCVGAIATAGQQFIYWRNGQISGKFAFIDSYINQIWLNSEMQLALLELLTESGSIPYNPAGFNRITNALTGGASGPIVQPPPSPVAAALAFGAIQPNVQLSASQAEEVNAAAGTPIDGILSTRGWFFQILPPSAQVRASRGSPICTLWYVDGGSIQSIQLNSIEVQ